jgi:hypothetical protein
MWNGFALAVQIDASAQLRMERSTQLRAEDEYNWKNGHRWFSILDLILAIATSVLLVIVFYCITAGSSRL